MRSLSSLLVPVKHSKHGASYATLIGRNAHKGKAALDINAQCMGKSVMIPGHLTVVGPAAKILTDRTVSKYQERPCLQPSQQTRNPA